MAKTFEAKYYTGTINDTFGLIGSNTGGSLVQSQKGYAFTGGVSKYLDYTTGLLPSGAFTVVVWARNTNTLPAINSRPAITTASSGVQGLAISLGDAGHFYGSNYPTIGLNSLGTNYRAFNIANTDTNWHCYVFTVPGNAQTDINSSQLFVDNVSITPYFTTASAVQSSRTGARFVGGCSGSGTNIQIAYMAVYDTVLSSVEIGQEFAKFLSAQPISKPKRGFIQNKATDLSKLVGSGAGQGLVGAWNMIKNGNTLVDISGNGKNGTINNSNALGVYTSTKNGLASTNRYTASNADIEIPSLTIPDDFTLAWRFGEYNYSAGSCIFFKSNKYLLFNAGVLRMFANGAEYSFSPSIDVTGTKLQNSDLVVTYNKTTNLVTVYINGVQAGTLTPVSAIASGSIVSIFNVSGYGGMQLNAEMQDYRIFNRVLSTNEITDYHNSFVQPTLIEDFSDAGADGVTKSDAPREWERVTGTWKIVENTIANGNVYASDFSAGVNGWTALLGGSVAGQVTVGGETNCLQMTISGGANYHVIQKTGIFTLGKRYKVTGKIYFSSTGSANGYQIASTDGVTVYYTSGNLTKGSWIDISTELNAIGSSSDALRFIPLVNGVANFSNDGETYAIKDIIITEIPTLPTIINGTKYLENVSAGLIAIPSNTAYGSWEFDWYKGADANDPIFSIISDKPKQYNQSFGYMVNPSNLESILFYKDINTGASILSSSANSYFKNNTWYRIKITRTIAGSFTLLIKGGAFTATAGYDGWTLVSTSGGSGTNPITEATYTTSSYFVVDLDAGDRVANIVIRDGIKQ